jgi:NADH dehydrogenase [ubiquinone] 1 alpha subcomplex assembly factor 1
MRSILLRSMPLPVAALIALAGCGPQGDPAPGAKPSPAPGAVSKAESQPASAPATDAAKMLIDFRQASAVEGWQTADDSVIGGKSTGAMKPAPPASAVFEGTLSQHSGGFVTVHCPSGAFDLSGFTGLEIRLRGDGRRYQAMIKTEAVETGLSYYFWFQTQPEVWQTLRMAFAEFKGNFRGMHLPWAHLDPAKIASLGFLIANWQEGPFRLEVESIKAYR